MTATRKPLFDRLAALGIETVTHEHPPVFTVEEARRHCAQLPGGHCKSLLLRNKKRALWLMVALDDTRIDLKALTRTLSAGRLSFASPELLAEALGVIPGAVTPFALINDREQRVTVVLDRAMLDRDPLNYHPLENDATTAIAPADLLRFIEACGHRPLVLDLDRPA